MKTTVNSLGRIVPLEIPGVGSFASYTAPFDRISSLSGLCSGPRAIRAAVPCRDNRSASLRAAVERDDRVEGVG
ncbi:MAG: citrate lyase subunit alpha, partial [Cloacibacillus porcorum]|nr:citrate lyase subunit alpha [Cloacibacillus porcorum]